MHLVVIDIDDVGLIVVHRRNDIDRQGAAHPAKSLGRTLNEHPTTIGREGAAKNKTILMDECINRQGLQIYSIKGTELVGALGTIDGLLLAKRPECVLTLGKQGIPPILTNVSDVAVAEAERERTKDTRRNVIERHSIAVAPARLTILGIEHLVNILVDLLGSLLVHIEDEELLVWCETEAALRQMAAQDRFGPSCRIDGDELETLVARTRIVIAIGARHPRHTLAELCALAREAVLEIIPTLVLLRCTLTFGDKQVVALGRKGDAIAETGLHHSIDGIETTETVRQADKNL